MKANISTRGLAVSNHRRRKDKESESSTDSAAHNQTLKQQKQLDNRNHHTPIVRNCQIKTMPRVEKKDLLGARPQGCHSQVQSAVA
jgi:hypothetical protein